MLSEDITRKLKEVSQNHQFNKCFAVVQEWKDFINKPEWNIEDAIVISPHGIGGHYFFRQFWYVLNKKLGDELEILASDRDVDCIPNYDFEIKTKYEFNKFGQVINEKTYVRDKPKSIFNYNTFYILTNNNAEKILENIDEIIHDIIYNIKMDSCDYNYLN